MTADVGNVPRFSPWRSVWFNPRDTIEKIVATNPRQHVLLLAVLGTISSFVSQVALRLPPLHELPKAAISSSKSLAAFDRELFQQK
jgi:hypothetical protein